MLIKLFFVSLEVSYYEQIHEKVDEDFLDFCDLISRINKVAHICLNLNEAFKNPPL